MRKRLNKLWKNVEVFKLIWSNRPKEWFLHLASEYILVGKTAFINNEEEIALVIEMQHERRDLIEE